MFYIFFLIYLYILNRYFQANWDVTNRIAQLCSATLFIAFIFQLFVKNKQILPYFYPLFIFILSSKYDYTVEEYLFQITIFWIAITSILKIEFKYTAFLIHLNLSQSLFSAGLEKLTDPAWFYGTGLYYVSNLPWIKYPIWDSLTTSRSLSIPLNYIAILFELSYVFLLIFKKTRVVAAYLSLIFFLILFVVLRIDFIGPVGILISLMFIINSRGVANDKFLEIIGRKTKFLGAALAILMCLVITRHISSIITNPVPRYNQITVSDKNEIFSKVPINHLKNIINPTLFAYLYHATHTTSELLSIPIDLLYFPNKYTTNLSQFNLFDTRHFYPLFTYHLKIKDNLKGNDYEAFKNDQTPGKMSGGLFMPRFMQTKMYLFSEIGRRKTKTLSPGEEKEIRNFLELIISRYESGLALIEINLLPIILNYQSTHSHAKNEYIKFLEYTPQLDQIIIHDNDFVFKPLYVGKSSMMYAK